MGNSNLEPQPSAVPALESHLGFVGWYHKKAIPFLVATGVGFDDDSLAETEAYRYWKRDDAIFITHIKGNIDGLYYEISRVELADLWLDAYNLWRQLLTTMYKIKKYYAETPGEVPEQVYERQKYWEFEKFRNKINRHFANASHFPELLATDERTCRARDKWRESDIIPLSAANRFWPYIDPSLPMSTYHFRTILLLREALKEGGASADACEYFKQKMSHVKLDSQRAPPSHLKPSTKAWRDRIRAMSGRAGLSEGIPESPPPYPTK